MSKTMVSESARETLLPKARSENLVIRELPDEVLVYDLDTNNAYCLNHSATLTWKHCDGKTSVTKMTSILTAELKTEVDADAVWLALTQLSKARLLKQSIVTPKEKGKLSRRDVIRKLGLGAAIAAPFVMSIVAPTAVSAASCTAVGIACSPEGDNSACCSACCAGKTCQPGNLAKDKTCTQDCQCSSNNCDKGNKCK